MAHRVEWDNIQKTVVLQQYYAGATKDDLYHLARKTNEMLATVSHTVHIIIDERNIHLMLTTEDATFLEEHVAPNQGTVIIIPPVGGRIYKEMIQYPNQRIAPNAFSEAYFVSDLDEARDILQYEFDIVYP